MPNSSGSSDFVRKLFNMLEDPEYKHILRWSDTGDSFIVVDDMMAFCYVPDNLQAQDYWYRVQSVAIGSLNEFTKTVLPRHFKHCNFASFVRQLNKYDFHKVRHDDGAPSIYGEGAWEFRHDDFQLHHKDLLDNIKRKAPTSKRNTNNDNTATVLESLRHQVESITESQKVLDRNLCYFTSNYQNVLRRMLDMRRNMETRDAFLRNVISYLYNLESSTPSQQSPSSMFVPSQPLRDLMNSYKILMNERHEEHATTPLSASSLNELQQQDATTVDVKMHRQPASSVYSPTAATEFDVNATQATSSLSMLMSNTSTSSIAGLRNSASSASIVSAAQQQQPQAPIPRPAFVNSFPHVNNHQTAAYMHLESESAQPFSHPSTDSLTGNGLITSPQPQVPITGLWTRRPHILVVEDDELSRTLVVKFLTEFECQVDFSVDGISAVNKANSVSYDLILIDLVLPNLDGLSVTCLIRQYDMNTPIVAMTSNISMDDAMVSFNQGVNDLLLKPFTKSGLMRILKKQLSGLFRSPNNVVDSGMPSSNAVPKPKQGVSFSFEGDSPVYTRQAVEDNSIQAEIPQHQQRPL
ncbi:transcription factor Prr1 [Schizosaccharomyces japonicus yFS275]|uniref:Transcription factor n=1 Tax=Schizosaccharomyces japonicus (strain yFS275 / FY16936) TaxID=402676 RepID=B6K2K3_SCHJY|nr:transcription factor Prr1 [Schizosaccharomyces japonicus yFS275]EEB07384.2 transcription factor Prr1 [Schizosaccharomyces japonicus yFS275]